MMMFGQMKEVEVLLRKEEMEYDEDGQVEEMEGSYNEVEAREYFERLVAADGKNEYDDNREKEFEIYQLHMKRMIGFKEAEEMFCVNALLLEDDIDIDEEYIVEQVEGNDVSQGEEVAVEDKLSTSQEHEVV